MADELYQAIGVLLKQARLRAGISQQVLAERMGVSQPSIARWESGSRQVGVLELYELARALTVPVASLMPGTAAGELDDYQRGFRDAVNTMSTHLARLAAPIG